MREADIGRRLATLRMTRDLTQQEVADAISSSGLTWHQQTQARVEKGLRPLRLSEAVTIARAIGCTVDDLLDTSAEEVRLEAELREAKRSLREAQTRVAVLEERLETVRVTGASHAM